VCPSCGAERAAELAAFLQDEVVEQVGHAQWVFTIPKMLRIYFLHHRELLGALSLAAYETVKELMVAAVEEKGFRPGMVSVVQTFGEGAKFHPHVHALCSRGGRGASGEWIPLPYVDEGAAEKLFRHKVLALLRRKGLLSQERIDLLDSWRRTIPDGPYRAALRRRWAELIRRVYEVDPLVCPRCGSEMRVIGFITQPALIDRILDHLRRRDKIPRPPPLSARRLDRGPRQQERDVPSRAEADGRGQPGGRRRDRGRRGPLHLPDRLRPGFDAHRLRPREACNLSLPPV